LSSAADWQVHRRWFEPPELVFFAEEADQRAAWLERQGRADEARALSVAGLDCLQLAKRDGGPVTLLWSPSTGAVRVLGAVKPNAVDGTMPHACPETCGCHRLSWVNTRRTLGHVLTPSAAGG